MKITIQRLLLTVASTAFSFTALTQAACPSSGSPLRDGIDRGTLPAEVRADYDVFAQRCSKCHSLARPLNSGIVDDDYWAMYVARMRRQPESGISIEDGRVILRFLHYYSLEQIRKKAEHGAKSSGRHLPLRRRLSPLTPSPAGTSDAG